MLCRLILYLTHTHKHTHKEYLVVLNPYGKQDSIQFDYNLNLKQIQPKARITCEDR